jgi:CBS domain-containing protein/anti-sigma regulatory factor (Ser/Thr protein kinase)
VNPKRETTKIQEMVYEMKVREVMKKDVITVGPEEQMSTLRRVLRENRISGLPVVDRGRVVGMISLEDFVKWLADRHEDCPIQERMTAKLEVVHDDDPLVLAVDKFERTGLGRFPVVTRGSKELVGILTKGNVIEGLLKKLEVDYHEEEIRRHRSSHIFEDLEADDATLMFEYQVKGKDFGRAGDSSTRLKRTLKRVGVHPDVVRRVAIASYEAEINQVVFTEAGTIRVRVQPGSVFLEAEDSGPGIEDVERALRPGYSTAPDWVREMGFGAGMGLNNIQRSSDRFEIESEPGKGTRLSAAFFFDKSAHEAN